MWVGWKDDPQGPAAGASVSVNGPTPASGTANEQGFAELTGLEAGDYTIEARGTRGGVTGVGSGNASLNQGETTKAAVLLEQKRCTVMIDVSWRDTGDPVQGAKIELDGAEDHSGTTDGEGNLTLSNVAMGEYTLKVTAKLRSDPTRTTELEETLTVDSEVAVVSVQLRDGAKQKAKLKVGVFKDNDPKRPAVGALVSLYNVDTGKPAGAWNTPSSGWITGIETDAGAYSISAKTPKDEAYGDASTKTTLVAGKEHTVPLAVYRQGQTVVHGTLTVTVLEPDGSKSNGVKVTVRKGGHPIASRPTADGVATFFLEPDHYGVSCKYMPRYQEVTVESRGQHGVTFKSKPSKPGVPWTRYFDEAYVECAGEINMLKANPYAKKFPAPFSEMCRRCMRAKVHARVAKSHPGEERHTVTYEAFWYRDNKAKVDVLDTPTPGWEPPDWFRDWLLGDDDD